MPWRIRNTHWWVPCRVLTLIGKSWKTHPEIFLKFSFSGSSVTRHTCLFTGKLIHQKSWVPIQLFQFSGVRQTLQWRLDEFSSKTTQKFTSNLSIRVNHSRKFLNWNFELIWFSFFSWFRIWFQKQYESLKPYIWPNNWSRSIHAILTKTAYFRFSYP